MGSDDADINNDGCIDMMTLDMFPEDNYRQKMHGTEYNYDKYLLTQRFGFASQFIKNTLQINQCDGTYSDVAPMTNMAHTDWSWSVLMADYNNDGKKDVFITNGYRRSTTDNDYVRYTQDSIYKSTPNKAELNLAKFIEAIPIHKTKSYFYMNKGGLQFSNVSQQWDPSPAEFSNGAAYADLDNDGFLDVVVSNRDAPPFVLKNNGATTRKNNFVRFSFQNEKNKPTYGAKIEIIDNLDNLHGWNVVPFQPGTDLTQLRQHAITELDTASGPADHAFVVDGGLVGVIEAKKLSLGPQNVLVQAERYARGLGGTAFDYDGLRVPFLWSTNGEVVWFHDVRHPLNASRSVSDLPTPNAIREALVRRLDELSARLLGIPNEHPRLRPYQREANAAIEAAIARTRGVCSLRW